MRSLTLPLFSFILLAALAAPAHSFEPAQITLAVVDGDQARLDVSGLWPDTCPPQLLEVTTAGHDVLLTATRERFGCSPSPTPYAFATQTLPLQELLPAGGIHRVRLQVEDTIGSAPMLLGFALIQSASTASASGLETGFWWAEQNGEFAAGPGLGLSIESQAGLISLSVMGYDARGEATWYFGAGALVGGVGHLDLGRFEGGSGPFTPYAAPEGIRLSGAVDVEVLTPSRATLWFSSIDPNTGALDLKPLSIVRFHFAQDPGEALLGRWVVTGTQADGPQTRWIELVRSEVLPDGFVLYDADDQVSLHCDTPPGRAGSPPALCHLQDENDEVVEFTDIALRQLSGWDGQGRRTLAFRLD